MSLRHVILTSTLAVVATCAILFGGVWTRVIDTCLVALAMLAITTLLAVAAGRHPFPRDPVLIAWALVVGGALFTLPYSANRHATLAVVTRLIGYAVVYGLIRHLPASRQVARHAQHALLTVALAITSYGLWSTLGHKALVLWLRKTAYVDSLTGTFINRSHFAAFLGLHLMAGLGLFVLARGRARWVVSAILGAGFLAQALTLSRGGLAATTVALVVLVILLERSDRPRLKPLAITLAVAAVALGLTNWTRLQGRLESLLDPTAEFSSAARISMWKSTLAAALDAPVLGFGAGTFESFYPRYRDPGINRLVTYAHQDYLEIFAEQGLVGVALFAVAAWLVVRELNRSLRRAGDDRARVVGIIAGLTLVAAAAMVDFPLKIPAVAMASSAMLALAIAITESDTDRRHLPTRHGRPIAAVLCVVLLAVAARATQSLVGDRQVRRGEAAFDPPWTDSVVAFARAVELDPLDPRGFAGLAHAEMNQAKFQLRESRERRRELAEKALDHLATAERLDHMKGDYNLERAWLFNFLARYPEAAAEYELAVADDPANSNVLFHAGAFHLHRRELGTTARGIELMRKAVHTFPNLFGGKIHELHYLIRDVDTLASLVPEDQPFLLFQLATYLNEQAKGEQEAAIRIYQRAVRLADWPEGWVLGFTGSVAAKQSREAALELAATVPPERRTAAVEYHMARLYAGAERQDEAIEALVDASERHVGDRQLALYLIRLAGDDPRAHAVVARYRDQIGEDVTYFILHGYLSLASGDREAAAASFTRAVDLAPEDPEARAGADQARAK